jgi:ribosomal protein S18 acetylase RimI-like enzyme
LTEIRLARTEEIPVVLTLWHDATDVRATDTAEALAHVIYRLAVAPSHRRRGIATALMSEAERRLKARGARRVSILVNSDETGATSYWQSLDGVRLDARVARYIKDL